MRKRNYELFIDKVFPLDDAMEVVVENMDEDNSALQKKTRNDEYEMPLEMVAETLQLDLAVAKRIEQEETNKQHRYNSPLLSRVSKNFPLSRIDSCIYSSRWPQESMSFFSRKTTSPLISSPLVCFSSNEYPKYEVEEAQESQEPKNERQFRMVVRERKKNLLQSKTREMKVAFTKALFISAVALCGIAMTSDLMKSIFSADEDNSFSSQNHTF